MSYSFSVAGDSKEEVKKLISDSFDATVESQPSHAADREAAVAAGHAFVDLLIEPGEGRQIHVAMHGSLGWDHANTETFINAGVSVSASIQAKPRTARA